MPSAPLDELERAIAAARHALDHPRTGSDRSYMLGFHDALVCARNMLPKTVPPPETLAPGTRALVEHPSGTREWIIAFCEIEDDRPTGYFWEWEAGDVLRDEELADLRLVRLVPAGGEND